MLPQRVTIEVTNACNRQCTGCPRLKTNMNVGYMPLNLYQYIIDQLPRETVVVPFFRGESLMHSQIVDMLYSAQGFREVQFASNGDYLTEDNEAAIRDVCSLFSLSLHEYQLPNESKHLSFLHSLKQSQVSILESLLPLDMKPHFVSEWLKHVDRVRVYREHSKRGYGDTDAAIVDGGQSCRFPFTDMAVYWNGKAALCCQDWDNRMHLGNLHHATIGEIWNSASYQMVRQLHSRGKRREVPSCTVCHQWKTQPNGCMGETYTRSGLLQNEFACSNDK